jgi:hypothetical protein
MRIGKENDYGEEAKTASGGRPPCLNAIKGNGIPFTTDAPVSPSTYLAQRRSVQKLWVSLYRHSSL